MAADADPWPALLEGAARSLGVPEERVADEGAFLELLLGLYPLVGSTAEQRLVGEIRRFVAAVRARDLAEARRRGRRLDDCADYVRFWE
jgi:hypothetical protein